MKPASECGFYAAAMLLYIPQKIP